MNNKYLADFKHDGLFHVYNRTNNKELLFIDDNDRSRFLKQYEKYLQPFLDTFSWSLLLNHFHFLVRVKSEKEIKNNLLNTAPTALNNIEKKYLCDKATTELLIEFEWKRFFTSYAMVFNKLHERKGNLFHRPFKRLEVVNDSHFTQAIVYMHTNPVKHHLTTDFTAYPWSSWHNMISNEPTTLCRDEVLDCFGGLDSFIEAHLNMDKHYYTGEVLIYENI
jgi:putative transposase